MKDLIRFLQETDLFHDLNPYQIGRVVEIARQQAIPKGTVIMEGGDLGSSLFIIVEGVVEVAKRLVLGDDAAAAEGANKVFTRLDSDHHGVFGEIALLHSKRVVQQRLFEMIRTLWWIAAATLLLALPLAWFFAVSIARPLTAVG